ncbi:MAG: hypothetical protein JO312_05440, partial [Hyphomicrobiales bacterium]|nr:hypothetical protein [Hyphomicrobiales bacterium]
MNVKFLAVAAFSAALSVPCSAFAGTILLPDTGWHYDQVSKASANSDNSPIKLIVPAGDTGIFSLTDGYIPGDIYKVTVNGIFSVQSVFASFPTPFVNNLGP